MDDPTPGGIYAQLRMHGEHSCHLRPSKRESITAAVRSRAARDGFKISFAQVNLASNQPRNRLVDHPSACRFRLLDSDRRVAAPDAHLTPPLRLPDQPRATTNGDD